MYCAQTAHLPNQDWDRADSRLNTSILADRDFEIAYLEI